jgi:hypothetical protein
VVEQRLQASEEELRGQLRAIPELRLLSDGEVQKVRKEQLAIQNPAMAFLPELQAAQGDLNAARARLTSAQADLKAGRRTAGAYRADDVPAYEEVARRVNEIARRYREAAKRAPRGREQEQIGYEFNQRLHQEMKRTAVRAGLELSSGPSCQLDLPTAGEVAQLSKDLRDKGFVTVAGVPFVSFRTGGGVVIDGNRGVFIGGRRIRPPDEPDEKAEDRIKAFQAWCDQYKLERLSGTAPTLTQMLQVEDEATRLLLVRELTRINSAAATAGLAVRAVADLSSAVRRAALAGLEGRPSSAYLPVLLRGLRYPWPPVADHAAVAMRTLKPQEAVASLVDLLDLPSPSAPVLDAESKRYTVCEVVRLNHLRNCLLCHAPSADKFDGQVRGLVPTPGQPLPVQYYESPDGDFVRADITYLRQDFSVELPDKESQPWPEKQRFDFVTRWRKVPLDQMTARVQTPSNYPQREAVLYALHGITGKDGGDSSDEWRKLLGLTAEKKTANETKRDQPLPKLESSVTDKDRSRP